MLPLETKIPKEKAAKTASSGVLDNRLGLLERIILLLPLVSKVQNQRSIYSTLKRADPDA